MAEHSIIFSAPMVRAILNGTKMQTRRIVKAQPGAIYRLTDDSITIYHKDYEYRAETNTRISQRRLPSGVGWDDLLVHQVRWIWSQGARGLVPVAGTPDIEGIPDGIAVPRKPESYQKCAPADLQRLSRATSDELFADQTPQWESGGQPAGKSIVGYSDRELAGSPSTRPRYKRRITSSIEIDERRTIAHPVGGRERLVQSAPSIASAWYVALGNLRCLPFHVGQILWVKETWCLYGGKVIYKADYGTYSPISDGIGGPWRSPIHMPRWASRITRQITDVRVQRVQDISEEDAQAEGCWRTPEGCSHYSIEPPEFREVWDSVNAKRGYSWENDPFCWVLTFKVV